MLEELLHQGGAIRGDQAFNGIERSGLRGVRVRTGVDHPHEGAVVTELTHARRGHAPFVVLVQGQEFEKGGLEFGGEADMLSGLEPKGRREDVVVVQCRAGGAVWFVGGWGKSSRLPGSGYPS